MTQRIIDFENRKVKEACGETVGVGLFAPNMPPDMPKDMETISSLVHRSLIEDMIFTFFVSKGIGVEEAEKLLGLGFVMAKETHEFIDWIAGNDIPSLCECLHVSYLNSSFIYRNNKVERIRSKSNLIETGAVYTQTSITDEIVYNTLEHYNVYDDICILDFACGTGRFYDSIVKCLHEKYGMQPNDSVLKNICAVDIDVNAVNITRLKAVSYLDRICADSLEAVSKRVLWRNALMDDGMFSDSLKGLSFQDFGGCMEKFDIIVSNPPYLVLKPNKKKIADEKGNRLMQMVNYFRKSGLYNHSIEGMLNLYQLSIERMLGFLKPDGMMGIICPSTLFADVSASKLRKHLLLKNTILTIKSFSEAAQLFENVTQASNIFYMRKGGKTDKIEIAVGVERFEVEISLIKQLFGNNMEIPLISKQGWNVLKKLSFCQPLRSYHNIRNRRGELDLTLSKQYITKEITPYRLVRGNMIGADGIKGGSQEFVQEDFLKTRSNDYITKDFNKRRLICQQISNGGQGRRLKFVFCGASDILGNSCNYISSDYSTLQKLYLLLNSSLLNWRFKVTSSNNHINNYELDELPLVNLDLVDGKFEYTSQEKLDAYIGSLYGLSAEEIRYVAV